MIKSRLNIFALVLLITALLIFLTFDVLLIIQKNTNNQIFKLKVSDYNESLFIMTWMSVFCFLINLNILMKLKNIVIDEHSKKITIKNLLTGYMRNYSFDELNGYVNSNWGKTEKGNRSIFLIKDDVRVEKISEFTIQNFDEILNGLKNVRNLGYDEFPFFQRVKNIFKFK